MKTRLLCSALALLFLSAPAAAQSLDEKIYRLVIALPIPLVTPTPAGGGQIISIMEKDPVLGGYMINGGAQGSQFITSQIDAACQIKRSRPQTLIFTDQEGGVTRRYKDLDMKGANKAIAMGEAAYYNHVLQYSKILKERCIDVNLAPVVNISRTTPVPLSHPRKIDEKRTYSTDIDTVKTYADTFAKATNDAGLIPTAKHFPGDILMDTIAADSPYISQTKKYRREMNVIDTDFSLKENIGAFFFGKPQFIMWSSNIFTRYGDKPAFMIDEFRKWIGEADCECLVISDALDEVNPTDDVLVQIFQSSDMVMMYTPPEYYVKKIAALVAQGRISESDIDRKLKRIDAFKTKTGLGGP